MSAWLVNVDAVEVWNATGPIERCPPGVEFHGPYSHAWALATPTVNGVWFRFFAPDWASHDALWQSACVALEVWEERYAQPGFRKHG